jgi:hypothetical protein
MITCVMNERIVWVSDRLSVIGRYIHGVTLERTRKAVNTHTTHYI